MAIAATFVDADTFTVVGDLTADFVVNRKVRCNCGVDGYKYCVVSASAFPDPNTSVDLTADSDDITANLTAVEWSVVKPGTTGNIPLHNHNDEDKGGGSLNIPGILFINETANANMTVGLTIEQAGNDDEILAGKSSDVAHPFTSQAEADTFFAVRKGEGVAGGVALVGLKDSDGLAGYAMYLQALLGEAADTTKTTAGLAPMVLMSAITDGGTGRAVCGADQNLVVIRNYTTTRFIFDAEGSAHADVEWIAFDKEDDIALLTALESEFARRKDPIKAEFGTFLEEGREILQREKVVNFYDDGPRAMVNFTRLAMLHTGGIRQNALRITEGLASVLARLERYEQALLELGIQPQLLEA